MSQKLNGMATGEVLKGIYLQRSRAFDEKTVSGGSPEARALKVVGEEADGWRVLRQNKTSIRMAKDKPVDRKLEDDVWCLLYRMGFKEMNIDRQFVIGAANNAPPRQIDIFAKDDETVFIVECTHSEQSSSKSVKSLIDKIGAIREDVLKVVHTHYGKDPRLKVKFAIATHNINWRSADRERAEGSGIRIITETDLEYFEKLTGILKTGARYQFLGRYFSGEKVEGLRAKVPATRGRMGGRTFYNFLMSPHDLLKLIY